MKYNYECIFCKYLKNGFPLKICDLKVSIAALHPDQFYLGRCLVILKWHETELYNLSREDRINFYEDMIKIANAIKLAFKPDKMNYAVLGNIVPHLHWHLIPRRKSDPNWGRPIWEYKHKPRKLSNIEYEEIINLIRNNLS